MKKLTKTNYKITDGSSFSGFYLKTNLNRLLKILGEPSFVGSGDNKVQLEWVFYEVIRENFKGVGHKVFTVYDYKDDAPINAITHWHVGSKGLKKEELHVILIELRFDPAEEIIDAYQDRE